MKTRLLLAATVGLMFLLQPTRPVHADSANTLLICHVPVPAHDQDRVILEAGDPTCDDGFLMDVPCQAVDGHIRDVRCIRPAL